MASRGCTFLEILIALLLPPLGVWLRYGFFSMQFLISVLLTILGYIPGIIYAVYVLVAHERTDESHDEYTAVA